MSAERLRGLVDPSIVDTLDYWYTYDEKHQEDDSDTDAGENFGMVAWNHWPEIRSALLAALGEKP